MTTKVENNISELIDKFNTIPLVSLPDTISAWIDDDGPPELSSSSGLDPKISIEESELFGDIFHHEDMLIVDDCGDIESLTHLEKLKIDVIRGSIKEDTNYGDLKLLGSSNLGFVTDDIRKVLWPKILRIKQSELMIRRDEELSNIDKLIPVSVYEQILKDVARSGSHLPVDSTEEEMEKFYNELTKIICWVLHKHPSMNYYQGYNDVASTVLIVMGLQCGLKVLEKISLEFLERFMEKTMERVNQELFYIFALLERVHPILLQHLENVELFPHFALAEYTTWYAHKYAEKRKLLHRLFDFFLGSPPLMPLYLSTVIVAYRAAEIFNTTPDMGHTHKVLCTLPDDLPFEDLLLKARNLYRDYPPESIGKDVGEYDRRRRMKEQEWKLKAEALHRERERQRQLKVAVPQPRLAYRFKGYRVATVVTILAIGLYAFLKTGSGLN